MEPGISVTQLQPDTTERFVSLRRELGVSTFGINQITLQPGERGRIHRHERQEEVYIVLEGTLTVYTEGDPTDVPAGGLVRIAPEVRRQMANLGPDRTLLVALGGAVAHDGRDGVAFADWDDTTGGAPQQIPLPTNIPADQLRTA
jgi:mannose-6-phosphate isomerase-like protein (cupin superfamily)